MVSVCSDLQSILDISEELAMDVVMDSCKTGEECERELTKLVNRLCVYCKPDVYHMCDCTSRY